MIARAFRGLLAATCLGIGLAVPATAGPYIWDQDENGLDDRMESVHLLGYTQSFESADSLQRQRFVVVREAGTLVYGMYVRYAAAPTTTDLLALAALGLPALHRLEAVPAVRCMGTFAQASLARGLPGVERIEVIPILYPGLMDAAALIGVRDATQQRFPAWADDPGAATGEGVVIAILDTGINDLPEGSYPGHASLLGRCLGGANFTSGDSLLDTPRSGSVNPADRGGSSTRAHGTHMAGVALGTGGETQLARGIAPGARFVDVKALNDVGVGNAVAEAIDWCIAQRDRDWGDPDPAWRGIDILNLSLSSIDVSDGNDVAAQAATRAVELGMVVVASMGNAGNSGFVPSPAAGDGVLAVGAWDAQRTPRPDDDLWPSFNNTGPRASDGDADDVDELKPELLAPGVAVLAADGDLTTDGAQYRRGTGTSPAAACVAGAAALLLSQSPGLTPADVRRLLVETASRDLPAAPPGASGIDPRWSSKIGYGLVDVRAARLELLSPLGSQVCRLELLAVDSLITARLSTQRELGATHFAIERAPDVAGVPGAFAAYDSAAAAGVSTLDKATNRTVYIRPWTVPPAERGEARWYRTAFSEAGVRRIGPARRFVSPVGTSAATLEITIVHNAYDHDLDPRVEVAGAVGGPLAFHYFPLPGSGAAVATDWVSGISATGNVQSTFRMEIPTGLVDGFLPPSTSTPWTLQVPEAGYLNRSGRVVSFRLVHHAPGGDVAYEGGPTMAPTVEGMTTRVQIPPGVVGVEQALSPAHLRAFPSPLRAGETVTFTAPPGNPGEVEIIDLAGRRVARVGLIPAGGELRVGRWLARRADGTALAPGVYFVRAPGLPGPPAGRIVILPR